MGDLTANFSLAEFACRGKNCCGSSAPVGDRLVQGLQRLREHLGAPLVINSAFRCKKHNYDVGGAAASQHTRGTAADVAVPRGLTSAQLAAVAESLYLFDGIGIYDNFVHLDVRGSRARWDCRAPL